MPPLPVASRCWPRTHAAALARLRCFSADAAPAGTEPLGEGDFCLAFRHGDTVLRVAKHAEAAAALEREAHLLEPIAARLPLAVPRPRFRLHGDACATSVHAMICGAPISRENLASLRARDRQRLGAELGVFLQTLHAMDPSIAAAADLPALSATEVADRLRLRLPRIREEAGHGLARRVERALGLTAGLSTPASSRVGILHCDVAPGHVLHDQRRARLTGIIDFGDAALGDPARDFVYVYADFGRRFLREVLDAYSLERPDALLPRMHLWYLLESLAWTLDCLAGGSVADVAHGVAEIVGELQALGV